MHKNPIEGVKFSKEFYGEKFNGNLGLVRSEEDIVFARNHKPPMNQQMIHFFFPDFLVPGTW